MTHARDGAKCIDKDGRDVTSTPGLWCETDMIVPVPTDAPCPTCGRCQTGDPPYCYCPPTPTDCLSIIGKNSEIDRLTTERDRLRKACEATEQMLIGLPKLHESLVPLLAQVRAALAHPAKGAGDE